ncbi:MAG TPA: leucine--tRNA ligase [Nitrososphaeraceae archaeon]|nr:leucine--tRNA ligase [Nitrososphaeraceae archaeon]
MINTNNKYYNNTNKTKWSLIEEKWRHRWDEQQIFNSDPDLSKKKYFITVAYPYPNSPQHIGHGRTYTLADAHARYMRMKGYNVLFPMGFHYTGTPILGMSRRVASGDKELLETFQYIYHVSEDAIKSFVEPIKIASYFHNEIKLGMKEMGYSIDWRREFTTIDKLYSKFISWQFNTLRKKGLIVQGSHPVGWCPKDQNPVSQHDTIGDVEPDFNEYILIKFKLDDGYIIPTATLRPETIYGVTNLWVNPTVEYVRIQIDNNERWIVSKEAARKLEFLNHKVAVESSIYGKEIIGKYAEDPIRKVSIPLYPASFVESNNGTGIVMSVPGHAPYDFQAIEDLKKNISLDNEFVGLKVDVMPITIIGSDDYYYTDVNDSIVISPAAKIVSKFKVKDQDDPQLEKATDELYSHEYYKGKMLQNTGKYVGMPVSVAKDMIKNEIVSNGVAEIMFELINKPVRCRCGTECVVKILNDQWFINYGDKKWKELAHECINKMDIVPEEIRQEFNYVIDWLRERACARKSGLGTKLPLDQDWIIESLSDSVIYMSYYILAKYVNSNNNNKNSISDDDNSNKLIINMNNVDALNDSFFDYILLGNGDVRQVAAECNISISLMELIRKEFSYFYPLDARHSGRDLVQNHLSFFIFNHVAIFTRENWPRKIVVNGSVLMEGKKMSKSLGNIIPLRAAIKEHSADAIRLAMLSSAELLQDADFSFDAIRGIRSKLDDIYDMAIEHSMVKSKFKSSSAFSSIILSEAKREIEDRWLVSILQNHITDITASMDKLRVRKALHDILYLLDQDLQWYKKRIMAKNRDDPLVAVTLSIFLDNRIRMLAPFAPFISEELWEIIGGNSNSIIFAGWPIVDEDKRDPVAEESEQLIINLISDLQNILKVTKISPTKIIIFTSAQWKQQIYQKILEYILLENKTNFGDIMKQLIKDAETSKAKKDPKLIRNMIEDILSDPIEARNRRLKLRFFDEKLPLYDAKKLLSLESGNAQAEIIVHSEDEIQKYDPREKSKYSRPFKPAIYIE